MRHPRIVRWSRHAALRARLYDLPRADVEALILGEHGRRLVNGANRGAAWRLRGRGLTVVYDYPDGGDWLVAIVVTVWRTT